MRARGVHGHHAGESVVGARLVCPLCHLLPIDERGAAPVRVAGFAYLDPDLPARKELASTLHEAFLSLVPRARVPAAPALLLRAFELLFCAVSTGTTLHAPRTIEDALLYSGPGACPREDIVHFDAPAIHARVRAWFTTHVRARGGDV